MSSNILPKVLLLGHQFDNQTGLGITLSNLFNNWTKETLSIMAPMIDIEKCEAARPCQNYISHCFEAPKHTSNKGFKKKVRAIVRKLYYYLGFSELRYKFPYNSKDLAKAQVFDPDIIFCCLGTLNSMRDCIKVIDFFPRAKLVLYIVDDWVNTKENNRFFPSYWRKQNDKYFRLLMNRASGLLSICPYMSEVYKERYGKVFYPFHNPVDSQLWTAQQAKKQYEDNIRSILYVGKINVDTIDCLLDTAAAILSLNNSLGTKHKYRLDVYTPNYNEYQDTFIDYPDCEVFPPLRHSEIIALTKSYDALLLTLGFSKKTREYVRLSMPTKLSEYLAAGIPTILYCPSEIALAKYLVPNNCSINCQERNINKLAEAMKSLDDDDYCGSIVSKALELAQQHDVLVVRDRFEKTLLSF